MTQIIKAFVSFKPNRYPANITEKRQLIPTEGDLLLSALEPFRKSQTIRVRVYDLETAYGRVGGILNGVSETPAVKIKGEIHIGLEAVKYALDRTKRTSDV